MNGFKFLQIIVLFNKMLLPLILFILGRVSCPPGPESLSSSGSPSLLRPRPLPRWGCLPRHQTELQRKCFHFVTPSVRPTDWTTCDPIISRPCQVSSCLNTLAPCSHIVQSHTSWSWCRMFPNIWHLDMSCRCWPAAWHPLNDDWIHE